MDTLENSLVCRLCGKPPGIAVNIFDKNENHVRKINAILPILVLEADLLPKQMCHRCSYKLEEFFDFYMNCAKTDSELKSQLSWMNKDKINKTIVTPMVKMNPFKIKSEPPDDDSINPKVLDAFSENSLLYPNSFLQHPFDSPGPLISCSRCRCICNGLKVDKKSPQDEHSSKTELENLSLCPISHSSIKLNKLEECHNKNHNFIGIQDLSDDSNVNRALRPRKASVDYMGHKKKGLVTNIKTKLKGKLDLFDPELVKPVVIKLSQNEITTSNPIIKLEKVDEQIKNSRTRKNLEEFNKRVLEFQLKRKKENREKKIINCRKNFEKEATLRRKSLQNENKSQKVKKKNLTRKNVSIGGSTSYLDMNGQTDHSEVISIEDSPKEKFNQNINFKLKQKHANEVLKNGERLQEISAEDKPLKTRLDHEAVHSMEQFPLCAVVKLEKDYSCNVNYPTIKIKRHLTTMDSNASQDFMVVNSLKNNISEVTDKKPTIKENQNITFKISRKEKKIKIKNKNKSTDKKLKTKKISLDKSTKEYKKNKKRPLVHDISKQNDNSSDMVQLSDLKRYCEKCDSYFQNKELYKLHPCYQN